MTRSVLVVGAGLVGRATAWHLQQCGHGVLLLDPGLEGRADPTSGSWAALGVLMAQVFHRSSGRAWRLRQRSLELWHQWRQQLASRGWPIPWKPGLLLLASHAAELERQQHLVAERRQLGFDLELCWPEQLQELAPAVPGAALGGLFSPADGLLDPGPAMDALLGDGLEQGLRTCCQRAARLVRSSPGWQVHTEGGTVLEADAVVLCAGVALTALLQPLGHQLAMEPVLGQALELQLTDCEPWSGPSAWPGAVVWQGLNLVPRSEGRLWLGATLEPGDQADPTALAELRQLNGAAPAWLQRARELRRWQGHRPHPIGRPAPVLEQLEPGLLVATGHYRNGVLLAPATAEWVAQQLKQLQT